MMSCRRIEDYEHSCTPYLACYNYRFVERLKESPRLFRSGVAIFIPLFLHILRRQECRIQVRLFRLLCHSNSNNARRRL